LLLLKVILPALRQSKGKPCLVEILEADWPDKWAEATK